MFWPIFLKVLYSALIIGLAGILSREIYLVWLDDRVFIGQFNIINEDTGGNSEQNDFANRVVTAQAVLSHQLSDYTSGGKSVSDTTFILGERELVSLPVGALQGIEVTIQNVNLTQIFSALRKGFSSPNEVYGHVTNAGGSVIAAVEWPRAPGTAINASDRLTKFYVPAQPTLLASAKYIACSLSWARGAAEQKSLAAIPRTQFCDYAMALGDLYDLRQKALTPSGLSDEEASRIRRHTEVLANSYSTSGFLPDTYRLRADLIDILPDRARSITDLVDAQEDRLNFAMLSPEIAKLPDEDKRYTALALALARPAIALSTGRRISAPDNWRNIINRNINNIEKAIDGTGLLLSKEAPGDDFNPVGTAFMVAPYLALTAQHVVKFLGIDKEGKPKRETRLCFGDDAGSCVDSLLVTKVHYGADRQLGEADVALLEIEGHSPVHHPPLTLIGHDVAPTTFVGSYAYVVGYPYIDPRVPDVFLEALLQKTPGVRRLIPGRILAFDAATNEYTSDISTTGGTSGAPLVDMTSGSVLGLSFAGKWNGDRGKFATAVQIPSDARHMIDQRLRGEPNLTPSHASGRKPKAVTTTSQ